MLRRSLCVSVLLLALMPAVSDARVKWIRAGACHVLTDAHGDVRLADVAGSEATGDKHVDVDSVYVLHRGKTVDVTIYTEALNAKRRGTWFVTFTAGSTTYGVRASLGAWSDLPPPTAATFSAGRVGRLVPAKGSLDVANSTITVSAPYSAFGSAGRKGTKWSRFAVDAEEVLAELPAPGVEPRLHDAGTSTKTYRAGTTCPVPVGPPPPPPPPPGRAAA